MAIQLSAIGTVLITNSQIKLRTIHLSTNSPVLIITHKLKHLIINLSMIAIIKYQFKHIPIELRPN